jgi:ABC-type Fe3+-hydroxamate transport system substrate-binding protein
LPTYPERIVCLTEETTETLYLLGEGHRVVGISGYTLRPPEARSKPKVSSFISARFEKIEALEPDIRDAAARLPNRPRVFFEEWPDPLISGIQWVEELIEIEGGDVILVSWCGPSFCSRVRRH